MPLGAEFPSPSLSRSLANRVPEPSQLAENFIEYDIGAGTLGSPPAAPRDSTRWRLCVRIECWQGSIIPARALAPPSQHVPSH
jgi:hypothetical protein